MSPARDLDQWAPALSRQTIDVTHWSVLTEEGPTVARMIREFAA